MVFSITTLSNFARPGDVFVRLAGWPLQEQRYALTSEGNAALDEKVNSVSVRLRHLPRGFRGA